MKSLRWGLVLLLLLLAQQDCKQSAIANPKQAQHTKKSKHSSLKLSPTRRHYLGQLAQRFTVKVETPDNQGSGVIISNQAGTYSVITNEHVILDSDRITIQTHDGRTYQAQRQPYSPFATLDLKLLTFKSAQIWYPLAVLKPGLTVPQGSPVIAAGYPHDFKGESFNVTEGNISHITAKGLNGGYRIGYSNWVPKGMSGGPVLNAVGQVIAINGIHSEPLWGNPYVWDDGTIPSQGLLPLFSQLSWAIPAETVVQSLRDDVR